MGARVLFFKRFEPSHYMSSTPFAFRLRLRQLADWRMLKVLRKCPTLSHSGLVTSCTSIFLYSSLWKNRGRSQKIYTLRILFSGHLTRGKATSFRFSIPNESKVVCFLRWLNLKNSPKREFLWRQVTNSLTLITPVLQTLYTLWILFFVSLEKFHTRSCKSALHFLTCPTSRFCLLVVDKISLRFSKLKNNTQVLFFFTL